MTKNTNTKTTANVTAKQATKTTTAKASKVWEMPTVKAVYNATTHKYDKKESIGFKATYYKATKGNKRYPAKAERVVVRAKGCCVVCYETTTGKNKGKVRFTEKNMTTGKWDEFDAEFMQALNNAKYKAIKSFLCSKYGFGDMKWETLKAHCVDTAK